MLLTGLVFLSSARVKNGVPKAESFASNTIPVEPEKTAQIDVLSPNGKLTLTMKNVNKGGILTQTFSLFSEKDKTTIQIYSHESKEDNPILIPYNTFSPDDKYIFLKAGTTEAPEYLVLRTDGKNIKGEEKFVEIGSIFAEKYPDFVITDVTGWGGYALVVLNSNYKDGKVGPSWWFDLSSFGFIRLSNRFN